ncbi:MAG: N-acetyltransferase [Bacteroidetes bacterium]|nr:MAG: N-acetyltransferase [Bacteroidota bacterium]
MTIGPVTEEHWPSIRKIYEDGILTGHATFQISAPDWKEWDLSHLKKPRLVAKEQEQIIGWAALTPVSGRCVYAGVAEVSIYIAQHARGKGVGKYLLQALIDESEKSNLWTLQAGIFRENLASLAIHQHCGFRIVGFREKIGKMNNQWRDTLLLERRSDKIGME